RPPPAPEPESGGQPCQETQHTPVGCAHGDAEAVGHDPHPERQGQWDQRRHRDLRSALGRAAHPARPPEDKRSAREARAPALAPVAAAAGSPAAEMTSPVLVTVALKFLPLLIGRPIGSVRIDTLTCNCSSLGSLCLPLGSRATVFDA